ncbi:hypothetical protein GCM10022220_02770 [Actinocatenispora rupis]|uniref:hypothetical protein n=1 Tax=Actinocatenispora rupis TaxID=519421 RepID=UPI0031EA22CB
MTKRRAAAQLAAPGIEAIRSVYCVGGSDAQRVAALIEIAGAAAALARTVVRMRHVDRVELFELVSRRGDVLPVLGRGQWLPTMTFHVPVPARGRNRRRSNGSAPVVRVPAVVQPELFPVGGAA